MNSRSAPLFLKTQNSAGTRPDVSALDNYSPPPGSASALVGGRVDTVSPLPINQEVHKGSMAHARDKGKRPIRNNSDHRTCWKTRRGTRGQRDETSILMSYEYKELIGRKNGGFPNISTRTNSGWHAPSWLHNM